MKRLTICFKDEETLKLLEAAAIIEGVPVQHFIVDSALIISRLILDDLLNKRARERDGLQDDAPPRIKKQQD